MSGAADKDAVAATIRQAVDGMLALAQAVESAREVAVNIGEPDKSPEAWQRQRIAAIAQLQILLETIERLLPDARKGGALMPLWRLHNGLTEIERGSTHPMMKINCRDIDTQEGLTEPREPRGVPREEIAIQGVKKLANFNSDYVLAMQRDESGKRHLRSLKTASL